MSLGQASVTIANGGTLTLTSPQAGNITMSTANRTVWGRDEGTNSSLNMNDWSAVELQNFVKWFIEVNHPEAVKQYQAIRDIERQVEHAKKLEYEAQQAEYMRQYWANQASALQQGYVNPHSIYQAQNAYQAPIAVQEEPKKSFWERCKELAKRPLSHGDFY